MSAEKQDLLARLNQRLASAREGSPYYGELPGGVETMEEFEGLPFVTKEELIEARDGGDGPFGPLLACDPGELRRVYVSGGPTVLPMTGADLRAAARIGAWSFEMCGFRAGDVVDVTNQMNWVPGGTYFLDAFEALGCTVLPGGAGDSHLHVAHMKMLEATGMYCFPSFGLRLLEVAAEQGIDPAEEMKMRVISISGEAADAETIARLRDGFGAEVRWLYGVAEVASLAGECEAGAMHVHPDVHCELVHPESGDPVSGEGELVLTDLFKQALPIVRLRTHDLVEYSADGTCACGRPGPRIERYVGRVGNILRVSGVFITPTVLAESLAPELGIRGAAVVIDRVDDRDAIRIKVVPEGEPDAGLCDRVGASFTNATRVSAAVELWAAEDAGQLSLEQPLGAVECVDRRAVGVPRFGVPIG